MSTSLNELVEKAGATLRSRTGNRPVVAGVGPGRVNIIGEHVDYAGGVVVPFAIDRACVAAAAPSSTWRLLAIDIDEEWIVEGDDGWHATQGTWRSYVGGVLALARSVLAARGVHLEPMSIAITSSVPRGSGLSSSAALTVAVAKAVEGIVGQSLFMDGLDLARLCQRAEREFAGVPCGLMDHAASVLGGRGRAIVLSCREPETFELVGVPDVVWLVVESGVSRSLAAGSYAALREASDDAALALGVRWLWDAREEDLNANAQRLGVGARRAATHVIGERGRVERALAACASGDVEGLKRELNAAHASLRDVLGVSCPELDQIVESAQRGGAGARLVGAGFGGCALVVVDAHRGEEVAAGIRADFSRRFGRGCAISRVKPGDGATSMRLA